MKKWLIVYISMLIAPACVLAQDFITRGKIEYEIKRNNKRTYSDEERAKNNWIANLPEFDIVYKELVFTWNQLLYSPLRKGTPTAHLGENSIYSDLDSRKTVVKHSVVDVLYVYEDSVRNVKWKIGNEVRKIAGFECRKAVGVIGDSVYVVAFYCPEIVPQGGPECFNGLPGMILGLAIPQYYTTWFATRIELASIDESKIVPPTVKKARLLTRKEMAEVMAKKYKEMGWWKDADVEQAYKELERYTL